MLVASIFCILFRAFDFVPKLTFIEDESKGVHIGFFIRLTRSWDFDLLGEHVTFFYSSWTSFCFISDEATFSTIFLQPIELAIRLLSISIGTGNFFLNEVFFSLKTIWLLLRDKCTAKTVYFVNRER